MTQIFDWPAKTVAIPFLCAMSVLPALCHQNVYQCLMCPSGSLAMKHCNAVRCADRLPRVASQAIERESRHANGASAEAPTAPADGRGARDLGAARPGDQRTRRPRDPRQAAARRGGWRLVHCRGPVCGAPPPPRGRPARRPLQSRGSRRRDAAVWWRPAAPVWSGAAGADAGRVPPRPRPGTGWHRHLVAHDAATRLAPRAGWPAGGEHGDHSGRVVGSRVHLAAESHLVPHRHGPSAAPRWHRRGTPRPARRPKKR